MKNKGLRWEAPGRAIVALMALAMLAIGVVGLPRAHAAGQSRLPASFSGLLNDYTPPAPAVAGGPYEMHGKWSLHLSEERGTASFSAQMTMERAATFWVTGIKSPRPAISLWLPTFSLAWARTAAAAPTSRKAKRWKPSAT